MQKILVILRDVCVTPLILKPCHLFMATWRSKTLLVDAAVLKLNDLCRTGEMEDELCWVKSSSCTSFLSQEPENGWRYEDIYQLIRY